MKLDVVQPIESDQPWYADGLNFTCTCCGNCCTGGPGYVWITLEEIGRLAEHLGLSVRDAIRRHCRKLGVRCSVKGRQNPVTRSLDRIFLKEIAPPLNNGREVEKIEQPKRVCGIYEVRPLQCRTWPFWDGNLASRAQWDKTSSTVCPGMNTGKHYPLERIEQIHHAKDWPTNGPTSAPTKSGLGG